MIISLNINIQAAMSAFSQLLLVDFASYPERPFHHAGKIGHDTREILKIVGYTDAQVDAMITAGEAVIN